MSDGHLTGLSIYPIKSTRAVELTHVVVGDRGFILDRDWMIVDARGRFVTQRSMGALAKLSTAVTDVGLECAFPGMPALNLAIPHDGIWRDVEIWGDPVKARDAGEAAASWLLEAFGQPLWLVWMPPDVVRPVDEAYAGSSSLPVSFADGFPILVANAASLDALNERLPSPIPMARFRPNIVVSGWPAFAEDRIQKIRCGEVELALVKPCTRCSIPSLDQLTGEAGLDPTPTLKAFRYDSRLRGVTFGVNAIITAGVGETLSLGQLVEVLA